MTRSALERAERGGQHLARWRRRRSRAARRRATWTALSGPIDSALRIDSVARSGPMVRMVTSPPCASLILQRLFDGVLVHLVDHVVGRRAVDGVVVAAQVALRAGVGHLLDQYDDVHRSLTSSWLDNGSQQPPRHTLRVAGPDICRTPTLPARLPVSRFSLPLNRRDSAHRAPHQRHNGAGVRNVTAIFAITRSGSVGVRRAPGHHPRSARRRSAVRLRRTARGVRTQTGTRTVVDLAGP